MNSSFASTFAPYTPPPDDPARVQQSTPRNPKLPRPWFPTHESGQQSYQSGGLPTFNTSVGSAPVEDEDPASNKWETRWGMRVDFLAAGAYLLGPISALLLLILETHNDYVRFHAYQSAILTTPIVLFRILGSIFGFWSVMNGFLTFTVIVVQLGMAFMAYRDAAQNNLSRFYLPYIGPIAEQWLSEE